MSLKLEDIKDERLYYIGGIVRDLVLGNKCYDIDITFVGNAIEYVQNLNGIEIIQINEPFGTIKIFIDGKEIDLASTRDEKYPHAGHLPNVTEIGCSLKKDVLRRDFTINTLAKSLKTGEIIDYLGGLDDIKNKLIRVIHNKSFIDDPTRIVRGLKFRIRFNFELEETTKKLQEEYLNNVNYDMSFKRLKKELIETFNLNKQKAYEIFVEENIYKLITHEKTHFSNYDIESLIKKYPVENIWLVYLGNMNLTNIPLTKKESKIIEDYKRLKYINLDNDLKLYKEFKNCELESILLYAINVDDKKVFKYFDELEKISLHITGADLHNLGIKPSPKYAECFNYILTQKLLKPSMTLEDEIILAKEFFEII